MRTGRPRHIRKHVLVWLKGYLARGPVSIQQIKDDSPAGLVTLNRAKRELGIQSIKTSDGWIWSDPTVEAKMQIKQASKEDTTFDWLGTAEETAQAKRDARKLIIGRIKLWLESDPESVLRSHSYFDIDTIKATMRNECPADRLQELLVLARAIQKEKQEDSNAAL